MIKFTGSYISTGVDAKEVRTSYEYTVTDDLKHSNLVIFVESQKGYCNFIEFTNSSKVFPESIEVRDDTILSVIKSTLGENTDYGRSDILLDSIYNLVKQYWGHAGYR